MRGPVMALESTLFISYEGNFFSFKTNKDLLKNLISKQTCGSPPQDPFIYFLMKTMILMDQRVTNCSCQAK